jgi:ethanolamine ammonia-lyase small subunit
MKELNSAKSSAWDELRKLTSARVGIGRVGHSLPTRELLAFGLAHAAARDAVHAPLDIDALAKCMRAAGFTDVIHVRSRAKSRTEYLLRPDLGRSLESSAETALRKHHCELAIIVTDGLSSVAVARNAAPLLGELGPKLAGWDSMVVIAEQARVALGDEIGQHVRAQASLVLIGERPGLSAPDSLGAYITWTPRPGRTDADRNCISNIRPEGLSYTEAAHRISFLLHQARDLGVSGVSLKDDSDHLTLS